MQVYTASWVVPVTRPPLADGRVAVEDGVVRWVGRRGDPGEPAAPLVDLGTGVLLPGLVNAHCHLELSHLAGLSEACEGFVPWVEALVARRTAAGADEVRTATRRAIAALEAAGTAAVGDVSNTLAHLDLLDASRLRAVVFHELIGWDPARASEVLARAADAVAREGDRRTQVRLAAHAPYSVSPALLRALARAGGPAALHLAESPAESRFLATGDGEWPAFLARRGLGAVPFTPPGTSPVAHVDALGALHERLVAAHCVQVDEADCARLAARRTFVALCPRSNRSLGVGVAPVPRLRAAGARLCLGTDSLASAPSLDLLEDAALLQSQFPDLPPGAIVHMATEGGAQALGLPDLGALEPGRSAALAFVRAPAPPADPLRFLTGGGVHAGPVPA